MDFIFNKDQELIRKSVKEFFTKECPFSKVRELMEDENGYDKKTWKKMAKLGYTGLIMPEIYGGMEGDFMDMVIFMEEIGSALFPSPYFDTVVLCALPILKYGSDAQKKKYLSEISEKGVVFTFAHTENNAIDSMEDASLNAVREGNEFVLTGEKYFVPYAESAQKILVSAKTSENGITLFIVDAKAKEISFEGIPTAAKDSRFVITFDHVRVPEENIIGHIDQGREIITDTTAYAAVLKGAEMMGGARAALDLTVKYTRERKQFERAIGSFQAVQFQMAELLTHIEGLKYLIYYTAWCITNGIPHNKLASMVKAKANQIYHDTCYHAMVLHGAIGWTEEMDISLYYLKSCVNRFEAGTTDYHMEKITSEIEKEDAPEFIKLYA